MANINDLKQNNEVIIDATQPRKATTTATTVKSTTSNTNNIPAKGKKTVVLQKDRVASKETRSSLDLSTLPKDTSGDEYIHESLAKDILEGEDSIFADYLKNKKQEMEEWVQEKEEEKELAELEEDEEIDESLEDDEFNSLSMEDTNSELISSDDSNFDLMEDEEFDTEEDIEESIEYIEDISNEEESVTEAAEIEEEIIPIKVVEEKKEEEKPTKIDTSDIELDENESTTTEIEDPDDEEDESKQAAMNDEEDVIKHLQELATAKLKPLSQKLDISSFTIVKKPTTNTKFLQQQNVKVAKWVLPGQERVVQMKEFLGSEIEQLREYSEDTNSISSLTRKFRTIYDHIVSPKPSTYEAWLKSTPYTDIDHYFFAIYIACFKGANYIPVDCSNASCRETFLTDNIPIMDMVKFDSEEAKAKFQEIYQSETAYANKNGLYTTEIIPLSNNIAVGFKEASIYSLMEIASLDDRFKDKFSSVIDYIPFIDALYIIDTENGNLIPIGYKGFADNATKTIKSKIQKFDSVLKTLSIDEFGPVKSYIRAIRERKPGFGYIFPSVTCPKCGTSSTETSISAEEMVFTRYQLGNLVTTSLK